MSRTFVDERGERASPSRMKPPESLKPANRVIRILMLEDNAADVELTRRALQKDGLHFTLERVETEEAFLRELTLRPPDLVLTDSALPAFDGRSALALLKQTCPTIPLIFVTGTMGDEAAIETIKNGAEDYVLKSHLNRLAPAVTRTLRQALERVERQTAEARLRETHEQLRALSIYLQYVREEERATISREVHDELGQALTGLKFDLVAIAHELPPDAGRTLARLRETASQIDSLIRAVRRIATALRPGVLDDLGLGAALDWQAREFQSRTGILCHVRASKRLSPLDQDMNTAFFRIFQEALTNVARHAGATRVEVRLKEHSGQLTLEVSDNGRGILPDEITNTKSIGLLGMRERASLLSGRVVIRGRPGRGTTVSASIPISRDGIAASGARDSRRQKQE